MSSGAIRVSQVNQIEFQHTHRNRESKKRMKEKKRTRAISIQA